MKWKCAGLAGALCFSLSSATGQQLELVVDQASGTLEEAIVNSYVTPPNDLAQSFTPSLSAVGFVQFRSLIANAPGGGGVTVVINLLDGSFNGSIISSTVPVFIVGAPRLETFYFAENIPVIPGQLYFFSPVVQSPGSLDIGFKSPSPYLNGDLFINGTPSGAMSDLWFREGVVVPEPTPGWLFL